MYEAGVGQGISRKHLRTYFLAHIKSLINYGFPLHSSASPTNISKLTGIENTAIRIFIGAWRNTPLEALYCEGRITPPITDQEELVAKYLASLANSSEDHP